MRGETTTNLTTERTYVSNLSDSLTTGVGSLVDASMNEAATKLAAVQVEQHLGARVPRLSDTSTQLILKLFERKNFVIRKWTAFCFENAAFFAIWRLA